MSYYINDMTRSITQGGTTVGWLLDPTEQRQRATIPAGTQQDIMHYADGSDAVSWTEHKTNGSLTGWERPSTAFGGGLAAIATNDNVTTTVTYPLSDLHGDIIATASSDPKATAPIETFENDEFGNPRTPSTRQFSWLGTAKRRTFLKSGIVQMGARTYVPAMGRFTSSDPVFGGAANDYDYAMQDPGNLFDTEGTVVSGCYAYTEARTSRSILFKTLLAKIKGHFRWCSRGRIITSNSYSRTLSSNGGFRPVGSWDTKSTGGKGFKNWYITMSHDFERCIDVKVGKICDPIHLSIDMIFHGYVGGFDRGPLAVGKREESCSC
jgi:RHS repeat-associated protein